MSEIISTSPMNLFTYKTQMNAVNGGTSKIKTPFGDVVFNCEFFGKFLFEMKPSKIEAANQHLTLFAWHFENVIIECLTLFFKPKLPSSMHVDDCICAVWRIKALKDINEYVSFSCKIRTDSEGSPESGECLDCQSFENEEFNLSIGTEDHDALCQRAESRNWLPERFQNDIREIEIDYLSKGLSVTLPDLFQGEMAQIQFIVAWSSKKNPDISTWYAVDQSGKKILQEAGVS